MVFYKIKIKLQNYFLAVDFFLQHYSSLGCVGSNGSWLHSFYENYLSDSPQLNKSTLTILIG